jgi:hypothetical protein
MHMLTPSLPALLVSRCTPSLESSAFSSSFLFRSTDLPMLTTCLSLYVGHSSGEEEIATGGETVNMYNVKPYTETSSTPSQ